MTFVLIIVSDTFGSVVSYMYTVQCKHVYVYIICAFCTFWSYIEIHQPKQGWIWG